MIDDFTIGTPDAYRGKRAAKTFHPEVNGIDGLLDFYNETWRLRFGHEAITRRSLDRVI
jgi:hypothetical protein